MEKILNEINVIRLRMGLPLITEDDYYEEPGVKETPSYWSSSKSWDNKDNDTYTEPNPENNNPIGNTVNYETKPEDKSKQGYSVGFKPGLAKKIKPNKFGISGIQKLTKPGDIDSIIQLMEYHQLDSLFESYKRNFNEQKLIETHEGLSTIIIDKIVMAINEAKAKQPTVTTQGRAIGNSANSKFFKNLLTILPSEAITASVSKEFEKQYGKQLNKIEIQKFLKELLNGLSGLSNAQMLELIKRGGIRPKEYTKIINSLYDTDSDTNPDMESEPSVNTEKPIPVPNQPVQNNTSSTNTNLDPDTYPEPKSEPEPEHNINTNSFLPEKVGNYDLSGVRKGARIALVHKAIELLQRNKLPVEEDDILEAMRQLIDDINKSNKKRIPTTSGLTV